MGHRTPTALSLSGPWPTPRVILPGMTLKIGRHPASDLVLDGPSVSRGHAVIRWREGAPEPVVEDLGSTNGTSVDGQYLVDGPEAVGAGAVIGVGDFKINVAAHDGKLPPTTKMTPRAEVAHVSFTKKTTGAMPAHDPLEDTEPGRTMDLKH